MSTHNIFLWQNKKNVMRISPLIWSYVEYKKKKKKKSIWDWQKLVLKAEWSYFRVVLIAEFFCTLIYATISNDPIS